MDCLSFSLFVLYRPSTEWMTLTLLRAIYFTHSAKLDQMLISFGNVHIDTPRITFDHFLSTQWLSEIDT